MSYDEHLISMAGGDGDSAADQLAAIEARAQAASPGPWDYGTGYSSDGERQSVTKADKADFLVLSLNGEDAPLWLIDNADVIPAVTGDGPNAKANAEFIAHARTDVPALLALVREQRAALALIANQVNAAEMLCRMNERDPALASVPAAAIRAVLTGLNP